MAAPSIQERIRILSRFLPDEGVAAALGISLSDVKAVAMVPGSDVEEPAPGIPSWVVQRYEETLQGPIETSGHVVVHNLDTLTPFVYWSHSEAGIWAPFIDTPTDPNELTINEHAETLEGQSVTVVVFG